MKCLSASKRFDEIRILPVYEHTFARKRDELVSYEHRLNMCKIAFENIPDAKVSDAERLSFERLSRNLSEEEKQNLRVGTADLLEMLMEDEPESDFSFCLGADTFFDLTEWKWRRSKDVLRLLHGRLVVVNREGVEGNLVERVESVNRTESANVILLDVPKLKKVSSSAARICSQEEELRNILCDGVVKYMKMNRLYTFSHDDS